MKIEDLPLWAQKYKTKGRDVRKRGNSYVLFEITSKYVQGCKYPKLEQKYLGVITEEDGLIEPAKKITPETKVYEYGLSHFIYYNFKRPLFRCIFNSSLDSKKYIILLGIIKYIYGIIDEDTINSTMISCSCEEKLLELSTVGSKSIETVAKKIDFLFKELIFNEKDRIILINNLKYSVVVSRKNKIEHAYPKKATEILDKYGVKYV